MKHVILILPNPDWIQLSNVARKVAIHPTDYVFTTKTIAGALKKETDTCKIHVVGHGDVEDVGGMSPEDLAKIIASSDCGSAGLKIRIDTCNSAADLGQAKLNVAQKVCLCLANMYKMKGVTVEGTVDSSITGFAGTRSRQVHGKDSDIESAVETVVVMCNKKEIAEAKTIAAGWDEAMNPGQIKGLATQVRAKTDKFFSDLFECLTAFQNATGFELLLNKTHQKYKAAYIIK
jgi:hypothetical protein